MGGHPAGEVASGLAVEAVEEFFLNCPQKLSRSQAGEEHDALPELECAFLHAHARILEEAAKHPEQRGMGTTLTVAVADDWKLFVAHAGHSRCYLFSGGELRQLTQDHTIAAELVRLGICSPKNAAGHPYRHVVTNVLEGGKPLVQVELQEADLRPGDVILLCSNGLTEMLSGERIAGILKAEWEPRRACERLVTEANWQGGERNITVVVARIDGSERQNDKLSLRNPLLA